MRLFKFLAALLFGVTLLGFADTIPFSGSSYGALNDDWDTGQTFTLYCHDGVWDGMEKVINAYSLAIGDNTAYIVGGFLTPYDDVYWDGDSYSVEVTIYSFDVELMPVDAYGTLTISFDGTENETQVSQYFTGQTWSCGGSFGAVSAWTLTVSNAYPERGGVEVGGVEYTAPIEDITDGETRVIEAIPAVGYELDSWSGGLTGSTNPDTITMDDDKTVTVNWDSKTPTFSGIFPTTIGMRQTLTLTLTGADIQQGFGLSVDRGGITINYTWGSGSTAYANITAADWASGYYRFTITNYNTTKSTQCSLPMSVSSAQYMYLPPPTISATGISPSDIILTITPNPALKKKTYGYKVVWQNPSGADWTVLKDNTNSETTSYSIKALYGDDLASNTSYNFIVSSIHLFGNLSQPSNTDTGITQAPYAPYPASTALTEVTTTDTAIYLSWTAPDYSPSGDMPAVSDYLISATDMSVINGDTYQTNVGSATTSGVITGLPTSTQYMVTVAAINSGGTGAPSNYILSSTTGETRYTVTINELNDLESVFFYVFSDSDRTETVILMGTNASGQDIADLLDGTYYYTASKLGYTDKQDSFTVDGEAEQVDFTMSEAITIRKDSFFQFLLQ